MELLEPWRAVTFDESTALGEELLREITKGHALYGQPVRAVARRIDCDDVLFALEDGTDQVAIVHLTWSAGEPLPWPNSTIYLSRSDWEVNRMIPDHDADDA